MTTTATSYSDANGSGSFAWSSSRYSGLQHVYFEAGIGKNDSPSTTRRIRSGDILQSLPSGTYKVRIMYGCTSNSSASTFTESGYAELWSADNSTQITSSVVSGVINSGSGACPASPTTVNVRFSRLIILQSNPTSITDTNTVINVGHNENHTLADTSDHPLSSPKIWQYTSHSQHPMAGWDNVKDVLFSATLAAPDANPVYACLYDVTSNTEITCVSTTNSTPTLVASSDVSGLLTDGDQYETYLKVATANTPVILYNSFVTVEQSSAEGLSSVELYQDFNPYPINQTGASYGRGYFQNYWEPANFNLPSTNEILSFHLETTENTSQAGSTGSTILDDACAPNAGCTSATVPGSNLDTTSTTFTRNRTADSSFAIPGANELDVANAELAGTGAVFSNGTWMVINVNVIKTYGYTYLTGVKYGPQPNEVMDECLPKGTSASQPGIVFIHGGGWGTDPETRSHYTSLCQAYASEGYVVYNIDYRLASTTTGAQTGTPWPDQIADVQLAVRVMRQNAQSLSLDPNRICAYGDSAGAHLALLLGNIQTIMPSDVSGIASGYSPTVNCVIDQFGPTDLAALYNVPGDQVAVYNLLDSQTPTSNPQLYQSASPAFAVSAQSAQTLITQGTHDTSVPSAQSQEMQSALQQANVPVQYMSYLGGHEYFGLSQKQVNVASVTDQINAYLLGTEHP